MAFQAQHVRVWFQRREFGWQLEPVEHSPKGRRLISLLPCRALGLHRVIDARAVDALRWFVAQGEPELFHSQHLALLSRPGAGRQIAWLVSPRLFHS